MKKLGLLLLIPLLLAEPLSGNRFQSYTSRVEFAPSEVITASYLGGSGTEWLVGGGFLDNGDILLVGNALGPEFNIFGHEPLIFGRNRATMNLAAPDAPERQPLMRRGNVRRDSDGNIRYDDHSWESPNSTAFLLILDANAQRVQTARRFPWMTGGATSARVGPDGFLYVAGPVRENGVSNLGGEYQNTDIRSDGDKGSVFLAKIRTDLSEIVWVREMHGSYGAPEVSFTDNGEIYFTGPGIRVFDQEGNYTRTVSEGRTGVGPTSSISPVSGYNVWGGERHWRTGREPWRCPRLNVQDQDGNHVLELYSWQGPFVGVNRRRLVSDSAVRGVMHDPEGRIYLHAWSDGGNSVMTRQPYDIDENHGVFSDGMDFSIWGANVLSVAYIKRLNPETYEVEAGTRFVGYSPSDGRPNALNIHTMDIAQNGAVAVTGTTAAALIQTGNNLFPGDVPGGHYIAIWDRDLTTLMFSSSMLAIGKSHVATSRRHQVVSRTFGDQTRIMFLSGAEESGSSYGTTGPAPTKNAIQENFGGGELDGYFIIIDIPTR
ncbi:MAG: hypothetical protein LAT55_01620 [Opitutales bacterium]|nr:hypothetical protein [Opitutales bacterium]